MFFIFCIINLFFNCDVSINDNDSTNQQNKNGITAVAYPADTWKYFLQHLPEKKAPIVDYTGKPISNQAKHFSILDYDVGTADLQQCADALIRLRSEYLFSQHKCNEIGFHFCSGQYYSFNMYCKGLRPKANGNKVNFVSAKPADSTHQALRDYLNFVYAYASTISLCKELKAADDFETGTVIIFPGSPGHTCIITDEAITSNGEKIYKLAEGYMPAQSIYILSNPYDESINPWYRLNKKEILTASCDFKSFQLKKFE